MNYKKQQLINEANRLIDEYLDTQKIDPTRFQLLMIHFIRDSLTSEGGEIDQSVLPLKGIFK